MLNRSTTTLLVGLIFVSSLLPAQQTHVPIKPSPSVKQFFDDLLRYGTSRLPKPEVALQIADHMNDINPARIREALPSIVAALEVSDNTVHTYAAEALIGISFRSDSADLLTKYSDYIGALLGSPDTEVQNAAVSIISNLKPAPPLELVSSLMNFVEREDRDLQAQNQCSILSRAVRSEGPKNNAHCRKVFFTYYGWE